MSTSTARVRAYRERRRQSGTVFVTFELSPSAAAILAAVREQTGDSAQSALNSIILAYAWHDNPTNGKKRPKYQL